MTLLGPNEGQHMCTYCSGKPVTLIWSPLALQYSTIRMVCNICQRMWLCHVPDVYICLAKPGFKYTSSRPNAFTDLDCSLHIVDMLGMCVMDWQSVLGTEQQVLLHCQIGVHNVILQHASVQYCALTFVPAAQSRTVDCSTGWGGGPCNKQRRNGRNS